MGENATDAGFFVVFFRVFFFFRGLVLGVFGFGVGVGVFVLSCGEAGGGGGGEA
jgi:hypothetical protein